MMYKHAYLYFLLALLIAIGGFYPLYGRHRHPAAAAGAGAADGRTWPALRYLLHVGVAQLLLRHGIFPPHSEIHQHLAGADFHDCYEAGIAPTTQSALELYLQVVAATPAWINKLMALRNRLAQLVGLKNLGHLGDFDASKPASAYRIGDRVGIFSIVHLSDQEVILGDSDKHLNVEVSVCKLQTKVAVSTVVHTKNALGRVYMLFVAPLRRRIVPASLRQARFL